MADHLIDEELESLVWHGCQHVRCGNREWHHSGVGGEFGAECIPRRDEATRGVQLEADEVDQPGSLGGFIAAELRKGG